MGEFLDPYVEDPKKPVDTEEVTANQNDFVRNQMTPGWIEGTATQSDIPLEVKSRQAEDIHDIKEGIEELTTEMRGIKEGLADQEERRSSEFLQIEELRKQINRGVEEKEDREAA